MATTSAENTKGHTEHTRDALQSRGFEGRFDRPIKITFMGAGSFFTPKVINDIFKISNTLGGEIALVDIDQKRLKAMHTIVSQQIAKNGRTDWTVVSSTKRREVLAGSDYIINCIEVSGLACVGFDNDIPLKYGVKQCIGDTIGPGGLFKALRTVPVWLEVLKDAEELCPGALVLNYTNPMSIMCLAAGRTSNMSVAGLCHSVQGTSDLLASRVGIPTENLTWTCAGINHLAWFTQLEHKGRNLYPRLMKQANAEVYGDPKKSANKNKKDLGHDLVRKDMMLHFGAFITESSGHLSEYLPYYRTSAKSMKQYVRKGYEGETSFYSTNWPKWRADVDKERTKMVKGESDISWNRSWEYASWIIESREKNRPFSFQGTVMNTFDGAGPLISNLSHDGCVEVAVMVDRAGLHPTVYGRLPAQMAALCESNMRMYDLAATAAIEKSKEAAIHALMLDPLTAAVCTPRQIQDMTLELFAAEKKYLKGYR